MFVDAYISPKLHATWPVCSPTKSCMCCTSGSWVTLWHHALQNFWKTVPWHALMHGESLPCHKHIRSFSACLIDHGPRYPLPAHASTSRSFPWLSSPPDYTGSTAVGQRKKVRLEHQTLDTGFAEFGWWLQVSRAGFTDQGCKNTSSFRVHNDSCHSFQSNSQVGFLFKCFNENRLYQIYWKELHVY